MFWANMTADEAYERDQDDEAERLDYHYRDIDADTDYQED